MDETEGEERSVLLGNGFSFAWDPAKFHYTNLFRDEPFEGLSFGKQDLLELLETTDLERIIRSLDTTAGVLRLYSQPHLEQRAAADAEAIRTGLCRVLARRHPDNAFCVTNEQYLCVRDFLANFSSVFTLNYDLLSYWAVNTDHYGSVPPRNDGFGYGEGGSLIWLGPSTMQSLFHIHGGFHLFEDGDGELYKLVSRSGDSLIAQLRSNIEAKVYPKIVTEGSSAKKMEKIRNSRYLKYCHGRLSSATGALFVHGVSLHENDRHVLASLDEASSRVSSVYVSLHGDPNSFGNSRIIHEARGIASRRAAGGLGRVDVKFYGSESANLWSLPAGSVLTAELQAARKSRIPLWRQRS